MTAAILKGILLGLMLAFAFGPSFFALLQTSIKNGMRSGITLALGIFTSDLLYVTIAFFGAETLMGNAHNRYYIELVGGVLVAVFGAFALFQKHPENKAAAIVAEKPSVTYIKGFFLNAFNPAVFLLWFSWVSIFTVELKFSTFHILISFAAALGTLLSTDILKVFFANKIRHLMTHKVQVWSSRILGLVLITIGINLMCTDCLLHFFYHLIGKE